MIKNLKKIIQKYLLKPKNDSSNCQFLPENLKKNAKIKVKIIWENDYSSTSFECNKYLDQYGEAVFDQEENEIDHNKIYICCISFDSTCFYELSARYMEKFSLISCSENKMVNYYFVKNIQTGRVGYIPKYCLSQESQFYSDLYELKKNIYL